MTDWRDWEAWRRIVAVAHDAVSSSALVGWGAARAFAHLAATASEYAPEAFTDIMESALETLIERQAARAPVLTVCNEIYLVLDQGPDAVIEVAEVSARRLEESPRRIGEIGAQLIREGETVLVHGASTAVRAILETSAKTTRFEVCCTVGLPGGEGAELAAELSQAGFTVELVDDFSAVEAVAGVDLVLTGADAVSSREVVAKAGTGRIAAVARAVGAPCYLTAATDKILPDALFRLTAKLRGRTELAEVVGLDEFTAVVSDIGRLDAEDIAQIAASRQVARELSR
jgi:translation initiation factor 2B subunit (eIF-2B alpha/beta/delta family)